MYQRHAQGHGQQNHSPNSHPRAGCIQNDLMRGQFDVHSQLAPSRGMYLHSTHIADGHIAPNSHPRAGCIQLFRDGRVMRVTPNSHPRAGCIVKRRENNAEIATSQLAPSRGMYPESVLHDLLLYVLPTRTLARDVSKSPAGLPTKRGSQLAPSRGMYLRYDAGGG